MKIKAGLVLVLFLCGCRSASQHQAAITDADAKYVQDYREANPAFEPTSLPAKTRLTGFSNMLPKPKSYSSRRC